MKFKTLLKLCLFNLILENKKKVLFKKPHQSIQSKPHWFSLIWFGSDFILKVHRTKQNRILVNVNGVRSFLGHVGFYRRFIKDSRR